MTPVARHLSDDLELSVYTLLINNIKKRSRAKVYIRVIEGARDVVGRKVAIVPNSYWIKLNEPH